MGLCLIPRYRLVHHALAMRVHPTFFDLATPLEAMESTANGGGENPVVAPVWWSLVMSGLKRPRCDRPSGCVMSTSTSPQVALPRRYDPQASTITPGTMHSAAAFTYSIHRHHIEQRRWIFSYTGPEADVATWRMEKQTRSHPEMVSDMSRVTLNYDLSKIPFVHF